MKTSLLLSSGSHFYPCWPLQARTNAKTPVCLLEPKTTQLSSTNSALWFANTAYCRAGNPTNRTREGCSLMQDSKLYFFVRSIVKHTHTGIQISECLDTYVGTSVFVTLFLRCCVRDILLAKELPKPKVVLYLLYYRGWLLRATIESTRGTTMSTSHPTV